MRKTDDDLEQLWLAGKTPEQLERYRLIGEDVRADSRARDFGVAVREARAVLGLTQVELAEKCGVQQREISRIEKCIANPTLKTVDKIMRALNGQVLFSFESSAWLAAGLGVAPLDAAGLLDLKQEIEKLEKKKSLVEKSLIAIDKKKAVSGYLEKVPLQVRLENDEKELALQKQISEIESAVSALKNAGNL